MTVLRTFLFYLFWIAFTLIWFIPSFMVTLFLPLKLRNIVISKSYSYSVLWLARIICGIKWNIQGLEHINKQDTYVILSKHQSTWETFFIAALLAPQVPVVKKELTYLPIFGWIFLLLQPISIDRNKKSNALKQVLNQGELKLQQGISVTIFPEGTRVEPGLRHDFSRSGSMLAVRTKTPILAIAHNSGEHWPNKSWQKKPGTIQVVFSKPFSTVETSTKELNLQIENWINNEVERISATPFSGQYSQVEKSGKIF